MCRLWRPWPRMRRQQRRQRLAPAGDAHHCLWLLFSCVHVLCQRHLHRPQHRALHCLPSYGDPRAWFCLSFPAGATRLRVVVGMVQRPHPQQQLSRSRPLVSRAASRPVDDDKTKAALLVPILKSSFPTPPRVDCRTTWHGVQLASYMYLGTCTVRALKSAQARYHALPFHLHRRLPCTRRDR